MFTEADFQISSKAYDWTCWGLELLEKVLKVSIKLHEEKGRLEEGDIFVFNHFARFETFIPQYLIYQSTGAFSRSVASPEFFGDDAFSRYLLSLGALPNDYKGLLPFLAAEVLRGRKVVVFPEGGMVKDRRVLDHVGQYSVYSRSSDERRKHHTGAAVVALALDAFKTVVRDADSRGEEERLSDWTQQLGLPDVEELRRVVARPTTIIPCNITFYPIRINENPLQRFAELINRNLSPRAIEELLIEGNILLRDTDMDLRMGDPVRPADRLTWWDQLLLQSVGRRAESWDDFFLLRSGPGGWDGRWLDKRDHAHSLAIRDAYMVGVYANVTVNLSHLASRIILQMLDSGLERVDKADLHRTIYLAVKRLQGEPSISLHRSLQNPDAYAGLLDGRCPGWRHFLEMASAGGLVEVKNGRYHFLPKLREEQEFDKIRLENLVSVYANEAAPLAAVTRAVGSAMDMAGSLRKDELAQLRFDDLLRAYRWDFEAFHKPRHEAVNRDEKFTENAAPFLSIPENGARKLGVLLIHGFAASPAEVRPLADRFVSLGYPCLAVRLKGHGTSPWDLLERIWEDWFASVREGYEILSAFADRICVVGFSAGASLGLLLSADHPHGLAGMAAVCAPLLWRDNAMKLVPVVHRANRFLNQFGVAGGVLPFHHDEPEHPHINYIHKPIEALYELQQLVGEMRGALTRVQCPVLLVQATEDPVVDPESADLIYQGLSTSRKDLFRIPSARHGILYEGVGETHEKILEFVRLVEAAEG